MLFRSPHRVQEAFHIVEEKNGEVDSRRCCQGFNIFSPGNVYLEEKARPSQDLSTSSDVSVKLEVENRNLGPSQNFDPFETSPSDMEAESTQSFKTTVDGDKHIKSNTYHRSDEASI